MPLPFKIKRSNRDYLRTEATIRQIADTRIDIALTLRIHFPVNSMKLVNGHATLLLSEFVYSVFHRTLLDSPYSTRFLSDSLRSHAPITLAASPMKTISKDSFAPRLLSTPFTEPKTIQLAAISEYD